MILVRATAIWLLLLVLSVLNGGARQAWLTPRLGELRAHQVSCLTGSLLIVAATTLTVRWLGVTGKAALLGIGAYWVVLAFAFECFMGRVLAGKPWEAVWADYNLAQGRRWPLVLVVIFFAPLLAALFRRAQETARSSPRPERGKVAPYHSNAARHPHVDSRE